MSPSISRYITPLLCCIIPAVGAQATAADSSVETSPLRQELKLINAARAAALRDDSASAEASILDSAVGQLAAKPRSVLLAQRTAIVCGLLQNADEWERASRLGDRAIRRLALLTEDNDTDRAERLYWEAWIEAKVLDRKARAIELLRAAEKLAPNDERVTGLALSLVASVVEFER